MLKIAIPSLLLAGLLGCVNIPPLIEPDPGRVVWFQEPTIGSDAEELDDLVIDAVRDWQWGRYIGDCQHADICVTHGFMESGISGRAYFGMNTCHAEIMTPTYAIVVHEIGHCLGLGHSADRHSYMFATVRPTFPTDDWPLQSITRADREALQLLIP